MHELRSDGETNTLFLTFTGEVTIASLSCLERTAVLAARGLDSGFRLVTNVSDCVDVTGSAIERIQGVVDQLAQFGLTSEVRIVGESTPDAVRQAFDGMETDQRVAVDTVSDSEHVPFDDEETTR